MPKKLSFEKVVKKNGVTFVIQQENKGYYANNGDYIPGKTTPIELIGVVLPLSKDDLQYSEAGKYSAKDRKVFTVYPLKQGQKLEYKGISYTVQDMKDYSDYSDVYIYYVRWAGHENSNY
ncbi:hypothetical protein ACTHAL_001460 [Priestia flexa]|uniref:hypothetical protein n=1 Tax=Priestia flexa TaxID=86664 RepID=UPI003F859B41